MAEEKKQFLFDNLMYDTYGEVTPTGDTLRYAIAHTAKPGLLYKIEYLTKLGLPRTNSILYTKQESGELLPGKRTLISRTSDWGKTIDDIFYPEIMNTPVTEDYSKVGKIKQFLYNLSSKYLENGGQVTNWLQSVPEEKCGGKVEKGLGGFKTSTTLDTNWLKNYLAQAPDTIQGFGLPGDYIRHKLGNGSYKYFVDPKNGGAYRYPITESEWSDNYLRSTGYKPKWDEDMESIIGAQTTDRTPIEITKRTSEQKSGGKLYNEDLITAIEACGGKMKKKK